MAPGQRAARAQTNQLCMGQKEEVGNRAISRLLPLLARARKLELEGWRLDRKSAIGLSGPTGDEHR